jgi:ArpU family phage transcriptional regulator
MTEEEAKKELKEYRYDKALERRKMDMMEELRNDCMRMTTSLNDMPKAPTPNVHKTEEKYIRYLELQTEVLEILNRNITKTIQITKKIQQLNQPYRCVLEMKYIRGETLWQIADDLNYSIATTNRVYKKALQKYAKLQH